MVRADIIVEYGPVEIGGKTYFCPVRSVSLSRVPSSHRFASDSRQNLGPAVTMLNDVAFGDYHMFRADMQIMTGENQAGEKQAPEGK